MGDDIKAAAKRLASRGSMVSRRAGGHQDRPVTKAAGLLAEIADQPQLIAVALATIGSGVAMRRGDLARGGARMLAAHLVATGLKRAIKHRVDRSRPRHASAGAIARAGSSDRHEVDSFPSGHIAGAGAATQPAMGSHHLTDMVVGGMVGWLAEAVVSAAFDRIEPAVERAIGARLAA